MFGKLTNFDEFTQSDFDAFEEKKWSNNRYNLERMKVQDKLKLFEPEFRNIVKKLEINLNFGMSIHYPHIFNNKKVDRMWLFFERSQDEQQKLIKIIEKAISIKERVDDSTPEHRHTIVGMVIDKTGVGIKLFCHKHAWLDISNFHNKLAEPWLFKNFSQLIETLPEKIQLFAEYENHTDVFAKNEIINKISAILSTPFISLSIGFFYPSDSDIIATSDFLETALNNFEALLSVYRFVAWSSSNDYVSIKKKLKQEKKTASGQLKKGDSVRILKGVFKGKRGKILSIDSRGKIKILLGKLPVTISIDEIGS